TNQDVDLTRPSEGVLWRRMKAHAPPPPSAPQPAPRRIFRNPAPDGGGTSGLDAKENMLRPTVDVLLTLPQGQQIHVTEDGSKALMDLLVELCSRYHLNPALHTLELLSPDGHSLGFKPNALLGSLNVACVFIKEKVWEEKVVRRPAPKVPEKTVRLMVNYHGNQKAVVRVSPLVPLQVLIPVICDKCDFDPAHVLLLKDSISRHELQLDKSLSDLGIKELYVHDQSLGKPQPHDPVYDIFYSICSSTTSLGKAEKKGLLGIFQFSNRRKSKALSTVSGLHSLEDRPGTLGQSQSVMNITRMSPKADAKKRRAPAPPGAPTPSMGLGSESQQRKRKAPAPPPTPTSFTQGSDDSTSVSAATVAQPPPEFNATPTPSSPTPSSSTTDSLAVQDSSSELSHSLDDSDADLDQAGSRSRCSTLSSSTASGSVQVKATTKTSSSKMEKSATIITVKLKEETASDSSSRSDTESALNLKLDEVENNRHSAMAWLHSAWSSAASDQKPENEIAEDETVSLGGSSSGSSLPDQGYAASEGMLEGEDSGMVSSPSDTQPTSPDGSLSLDGSGRGRGEKLLRPVRDSSSDSDEGCATWGSIHSQFQDVRLKNCFEEDPEITAQLHQTLADFEANLAGELTHQKPTVNNEVPVSVVDMDVPVTAIDEVMEVYEHNTVKHEVKALTRTESTGSKGTAGRNDNLLKKTEKSPESVKKNLQAFQQKKPDLPTSQRSVSTEKDEENHRVYQIKSSSSTSQGKITHNVTSRFGMRTFTVVPPKPAVTHAANKQSDVPFTIGAIKIDDQGNMVSSGVFRNKVGGSSESEINHDKSSPLLEKAKAFWSSNEKQESPVIPSKSLVDKAKESTNELEKDVQAVNEEKVEIKISVSKNIQQRDLSFLKPSRRTSSQYVASAISKYTPVASAKAISTLKSHDYSASSKTQTPAFHRLGRSMQVNPHQSSMSSLSENKEYISTSTSSPGPKRSMSFPEPVSDIFENKYYAEFLQNNCFYELQDSTVIIKTVTHLTQNAKPQPSVTVTDSGVIPPPPSVTVFGPIAKFKPVIHKSVEKETSLHSSLMEAIQSGGGRDRLKKLEKLRKVAAEEEKSAASSSSFSYSSSVFTPPPPPPPAPTAAPPPPPPPVLPQAKPSSVAHPNADALKNAALAREVMLEAIRSGSAAERLKKVQIQKKRTIHLHHRV
uniref:Cordon-bleu WH2 repeat protein n=1 Tax=Amphiprion percula TaxID=161767 RepID=A0A3P8TH47_AMPPE